MGRVVWEPSKGSKFGPGKMRWEWLGVYNLCVAVR